MVDWVAPSPTRSDCGSEKNSTLWSINFKEADAFASDPFPPVIDMVGFSM